MRFANSGLALLLAVSIVLFHSAVFAGETLDAVKARGYLIVGVNGELYGFGMPDEKGVWRGLDVNTGRAIAAAIFGDPGKIRFVTLTTQTRFTALKFKEVDVLCRNASKTLTHEAELGLDFVAVNYYDGQGFLIRKKLGVKNARELNGAAVCVMRGTTSERNAANFFRSNKIAVKPVLVEQSTELNQALFTGKCDCLTFDVSQLAGIRAVAANPNDYVILPEVISREPLAPAVRYGDKQWRDIVDFSVLAMIAAEDFGITSKNVDDMLKSPNAEIQGFLGVIPGNGKALGLDEKWAYNIVKKVGNYGEVFDRNVGPDTKLELNRGLNAQWQYGGLMYAPPFK